MCVYTIDTYLYMGYVRRGEICTSTNLVYMLYHMPSCYLTEDSYDSTLMIVWNIH